MFDVIILGARCAGSPLAMLLARKSYHVLVVDKAEFPSDTVSTHVIWHAGLARAKKWGLLDRILTLGAPPIDRVGIDIGEFYFSGRPLPLDGIHHAVAPRRILLDKLLVDAARDAGAEVRERFYVSEILHDRNRVSGIRGRTPGGALVEERAHIVIGADGVHSLVARATKAHKYNEQPSAGGAAYTYWSGGPPLNSFDTFIRKGWGGAIIPTNDGQVCIILGWTHETAGSWERNEDRYLHFVQQVPQLREYFINGRQMEPLRTMREFAGFFRKSSGDGWALAGDAGYHKHPLSAQGISDAFRDADMLAGAIHDGLSGRRSLADSLVEYERLRDEAVLPMFESTCRRALMEAPPPEVQALFRALKNNPVEADRFFSTDAGSVPIPEFFAPENLERIVRTSGAAHARRFGA